MRKIRKIVMAALAALMLLPAAGWAVEPFCDDPAATYNPVSVECEVIGVSTEPIVVDYTCEAAYGPGFVEVGESCVNENFVFSYSDPVCLSGYFFNQEDLVCSPGSLAPEGVVIDRCDWVDGVPVCEADGPVTCNGQPWYDSNAFCSEWNEDTQTSTVHTVDCPTGSVYSPDYRSCIIGHSPCPAGYVPHRPIWNEPYTCSLLSDLNNTHIPMPPCSEGFVIGDARDTCVATLSSLIAGIYSGGLSGDSNPVVLAGSIMESLLNTKRAEKETASETGIIVGLEVY